MFGIRYPQFDKASDGGSGGGGDGGGKGDDGSKAAEELGKMVNAAVTSQLKRMLAPAVADAIKGVNWGETLKLDEVLETKLSKLLEDEGDEPTGGKGGQQPPKPDPKIAALEAQLTELKTQRAADAEALKKEKEANRDKDAMTALRSALTEHVRPEALDIAVRDLFIGQKRVTFDEQGNPLFTVRRAPYAGAAEEDTPMPLADGVTHWVKTPEGKFFAPAPGGQGGREHQRGGTGPARRVAAGADGMPQYDKPAASDAERDRRVVERTEALKARFPDRF